MNLNQLLIWTVCLSCIAFLIRAFRSHPRRNLGWVVVAGAILTITLVGWALVPDIAGLIASILWGIFLLIPLIGFTRVNKLIYQQRYKQAHLLASYLRWLHPADGWFEQPELLRALALGQRGQMEEAFAILQHHQNTRSPIGRDAAILLYWMGSRWYECLAWMRQNFSQATLCQETRFSNILFAGFRRDWGLKRFVAGDREFPEKLRKGWRCVEAKLGADVWFSVLWTS